MSNQFFDTSFEVREEWDIWTFSRETEADALGIINAHLAGWPYSRPVDGALLAHWTTLGAMYQPDWMFLAYRHGAPRAFLHAEVMDGQVNLHLLAMLPGAVEEGMHLLRHAEAQARAAGLTRICGPYYRSSAFYGGFACGLEPYTPQWALDTTSAYVRSGFRISHHGVVLVADLAEPVETRPAPAGYRIAPATPAEEYDAQTFRFVALADGEEVATCAARFFPRLPSPAGGPVGQVGFVGTQEAHRGKGLAKALVIRSLARLREMGAAEALIATGMENYPALASYEAVGFRRWCMINEWSKELKG